MKNKLGFTLLELLVVVLVIGILAAIALPQYKFAVAKSKYATLKNITKSLKESVDRYYLATGEYPTKYGDLDIDLNINNEWDYKNVSFYIFFPGVDSCEIYYKNNTTIWCKKIILGTLMTYSDHAYPTNKRVCLAYSSNTSDVPNRVCQSETGKTAEQGQCQSSYCSYNY